MKFMLIIYGSHDAWDAMGEAGMKNLEQAHASLVAELRATGELIEVNELSVTEAKVVRTRGGVPIVTDGPFIEGKEIVAGYYLVNCATLERATEIAGRLTEAEFAPIDVRQVG